ncbi:hypothetical protein [Sellimonas intestinalis]|uniref:hypothetical protein n=1 Tax=Sellimonas intestinalis TaxID=1653434 RepID=UPI0039A2ED96
MEPNTRTRFYTDDDLARLQQILLFKALGFFSVRYYGNDNQRVRYAFHGRFPESSEKTGGRPH